MIVTTTPSIEGRPVKDYLGIVTGEAVMTGNLSDLGAALQNLGSSRSYVSEKYMVKAYQVALEKLTARAADLGANAVVGIKVDCESDAKGTVIMAVGTAVTIP